MFILKKKQLVGRQSDGRHGVFSGAFQVPHLVDGPHDLWVGLGSLLDGLHEPFGGLLCLSLGSLELLPVQPINASGLVYGELLLEKFEI